MRGWTRRVPGMVVAAVGAAFIVVVIVDRLFTVGPAFERMSDGFRPIMKPAPIALFQRDVQGMRAAAGEFVTTAEPKLAQGFGMDANSFDGLVWARFPAVAAGRQQVPQIAGQFDGVVRTLGAEQARFASADSIPTSSLPATTVPWGLLIAGIVLFGLGIVMVVRPLRVLGGIAAILGVLLFAVPFALSLPTKASNADTLNSHLKAVYTAEMVSGAKASLATIGAMGAQMQEEMLPSVARQMGMTPEQLQSFLQKETPTVAGLIATMPETMGRFQSLVGTFDRHLGDFDAIKNVAFVPVVWTLIGGGILVLLAGAFALLAARGVESQTVEEERRHLRAA
jgi:hypothetical protein